jgi:hypothetical protein
MGKEIMTEENINKEEIKNLEKNSDVNLEVVKPFKKRKTPQYTANAYKKIHTKYTRQRKREQEIKARALKVKEAFYNLWRILNQIHDR